MDNSNANVIGFICPAFPVKVSLAYLSDGKENACVKVDGSTHDLITGFTYIASNIAKMLYKSAKEDIGKSREEVVEETLSSMVDIALLTGIDAAKEEEKEDK